MSCPSKLLTYVAVPMALLGVAAALRLAVHEGIPFYPDSYQFMLLARELADSPPVEASLGAGGDAWGIPFHRLGYGFIAAPFSLLSDGPFSPGLLVSFLAGMGTVAAMYFLAGLAFRSWWAGFLAGAVTAVSFSAVAWSRFPMSEALGAYVLAQTMLLAVAAGRTGRTSIAMLAGASAAIALLVRFDLAPLLLSTGLLMYAVAVSGTDGRRLLATFGASWAVLSIIVAGVAGLLAHEAIEGFSLNPLFLIDSAFAKPMGSAELGQGTLGAGGWDFISRDPILVLGAAVGSVVGLQRREARVLAVLPGLLTLLAVYTAWNDMRHFALTVPALAYLSAYGLLEVGRLGLRFLESSPVSAAAAVGGLAAFAIAILLGFQVHLTVSPWHVDKAYEYEIARAVGEKLEAMDMEDVITVCSYSPEAYFLLHDLPAERLSEPDLSLCDLGTRPVVVVVDEPVRSRLAPLAASAEGSLIRLFAVETDAPYLEGRSVRFETDPAIVYVAR